MYRKEKENYFTAMGILSKVLIFILLLFQLAGCDKPKEKMVQIDNWTERIKSFNSNHYKNIHSSMDCNSKPLLPPSFFHGKTHLTYDEWVSEVILKHRSKILKEIDIPKHSLINEKFSIREFSLFIQTNQNIYKYSGTYDLQDYLLEDVVKMKSETTIEDDIYGALIGVSEMKTLPNCDISHISTMSYYGGQRFIVLSVNMR